ncbi:methionine aminopeptidase 1D, mitochondrial-like isoform X2 [Littorina saxatilis]|uniref:methionine aminopeptidase 1D, mitochondrial-like isoform X2 n=1 Tax=Littorina saxatilis TaxID=31220 RepID=UPI0038B52FE5
MMVLTYSCMRRLCSLASQWCHQSRSECRRRLSIAAFLHSFKKRHYHIVSPGHVSPLRKVPESIPKPLYALNGSDDVVPREAEVKSAVQIAGMRRACALAASLLQFAGSYLQVGMTTDEVDRAVHEKCLARGAYPSPLLYKGYPKSICTSVNNVACHGIPDDRPLCDGDIVNVDITVFYEGFHGDTSATFLIGHVDEAGQKLVEVARRCRDAGVAVCRPGTNLRGIGKAISKCAEAEGCSVIPEFCGHGIGEYFHGPPDIIHIDYATTGKMRAGMTFTIGGCEIKGRDSRADGVLAGCLFSSQLAGRTGKKEASN